MRAAPAFADLPDDAAGHMVPGEEFRRPPRLLVPLRVPPALFRVRGGLVRVEVRDVVEHEPAAFAVAQDAAFAAHAFGDQDPAHAGRPDHPGGMELDILHVDEFRAGFVGERVAVAGVFPTVGGDAERAADAAGGEDHRRSAEQVEPPPLPVVTEGADHPAAVGEQPGDRPLHVDLHTQVDSVILQRADHLQPGAVAHMGEARVLVAAEVALEDPLVVGAVEHRAPGLEFPDPVGGFPRVELGHRRVVHILPAAHGVGEVGLPIVPAVHIGERGGDPALRHHRVRLAEERLGDQADPGAGRRSLDRRPQPRAPCADDEHIVLGCLHRIQRRR